MRSSPRLPRLRNSNRTFVILEDEQRGSELNKRCFLKNRKQELLNAEMTEEKKKTTVCKPKFTRSEQYVGSSHSARQVDQDHNPGVRWSKESALCWAEATTHPR